MEDNEVNNYIYIVNYIYALVQITHLPNIV